MNWTKVTDDPESLPGHNQRVLIFFSDNDDYPAPLPAYCFKHGVGTLWFEIDKDTYGHDDNYPSFPTHWAPWPEPPDENETVEDSATERKRLWKRIEAIDAERKEIPGETKD